MSRITLNLKKSVHKVHDIPHIRAFMPSMFTQRSEFLVTGDIQFAAPGTVRTVDSDPGALYSQSEMIVLTSKKYPPPQLGRGAREALREGPIRTLTGGPDGDGMQTVRFVDEIPPNMPMGRMVQTRTQDDSSSEEV